MSTMLLILDMINDLVHEEGPNGGAKGYGPITTSIQSAEGHEFWLAEEYHQRYLEKNPKGYDCHVNTGVRFPVELAPEIVVSGQYPVVIDEHELRSRVDELSFEVLRRAATERRTGDDEPQPSQAAPPADVVDTHTGGCGVWYGRGHRLMLRLCVNLPSKLNGPVVVVHALTQRSTPSQSRSNVCVGLVLAPNTS